jgi:hypothetical protein
MALHDRFAHCSSIELSVRGHERGTQATRLLNDVNCLLFGALALRSRELSEAELLSQLREGADGAMPLDPAGRAIRNAIDILLEIVLTRECLPAPFRLPEHDPCAAFLFMDAEHWSSELGRYHFENELGYLAGCLRAFRHLMSLDGRPLTAEALCEVHDVAVCEAFRRAPVPMTHPFQLGYRSQAVSFPLIEGRNFTALGYEEFLASPDSSSGWVTVGSAAGGAGLQLTANARTSMECRDKAAGILAAYYRELHEASGEAAEVEGRRLLSTVRCCQSLNRNHLFADANIRTIGYLCLNKFLLDLGMAPAVLEYPKVLDMCAAGEVMEAVHRGQARYRALQGRVRVAHRESASSIL